MQDDQEPDGGDEAPGSGPLPDVYGRPSAARSEGQLYAPPRTVPPTSDHRTIEIETVKVHKDPQRAAVTQPSLRKASEAARAEGESAGTPWEEVPGSEPPDAPAAVPDSTHPVIAGERSHSASAVWLLALGALVALVAVGLALAHGHSSAPEPASAQQPAQQSAAVAPPPAAQSAAPAPEPQPTPSVVPEPAASAAPEPTPAPSAIHHAPASAAAPNPTEAPKPEPTAKPADSSKPKYQPLF